jgi:hypothetical protein
MNGDPMATPQTGNKPAAGLAHLEFYSAQHALVADTEREKRTQ